MSNDVNLRGSFFFQLHAFHTGLPGAARWELNDKHPLKAFQAWEFKNRDEYQDLFLQPAFFLRRRS